MATTTAEFLRVGGVSRALSAATHLIKRFTPRPGSVSLAIGVAVGTAVLAPSVGTYLFRRYYSRRQPTLNLDVSSLLTQLGSEEPVEDGVEKIATICVATPSSPTGCATPAASAGVTPSGSGIATVASITPSPVISSDGDAMVLPIAGAAGIVAPEHTDTVGRKLAKRCGLEIRNALGCPRRTEANRILVTQRCDQWLSEHAKSLRRSIRQTVLMRSVLVALTVCPEEKELATALFSVNADDDESFVSLPHLVPTYMGGVGRFLARLGFARPAVANF